MSNYLDDKMEHIESDIKKIQIKTGMYISYVGKKGALHLCKEIIQNSIDECANPKSPGKSIYIKLDTGNDSILVEDDGRGIPENDVPMEILFTRLNAGSKFTREQGGATSGENGTGGTAVNALSEYFEVTSYRNSIFHKLRFEHGEKVEDKSGKNKKEHGTIISFSPSKKYLGKTATIPKEDLKKWIENISYFLPKDCKIKFEIYDGLKLLETHKFKFKPLEELMKSSISDDNITPIFSFKGKTKLVEDYQGIRKIKRELELDFVFTYNNSLEPYVDSFCNYVNTTSGGTHLEAVREAIWRYFMKKTNEVLSEREKSKYKILKVDIENGLNLIVNIFTDMQMQFVGQTKNEVSNDLLTNPIKDIATNSLEEYFEKNKEKLNNITKIIKMNCKARLEANKARTASVKGVSNKLDRFLVDNFTPCNNTGKSYKEIHVCEGNSAKESMVNGRDPDTQAFLAFRGVLANAFKRDSNSILENNEWANYVRILGTGFGKNFDITKLNYNKIILETDSDIDGAGISSAFLAFHVLFMPELITEGKLYKGVAPLYLIDDKKKYIRDKSEFVDVYKDKIINNYDMFESLDSKNKLPKKDFREFIFDTQDYMDNMVLISKHFGINKFLIELIGSYLIMVCMNDYGFNISLEDLKKTISDVFNKQEKTLDLLNRIQSVFPEIILKGTNSLVGVVEGRFQSIEINRRFANKIFDIMYPVILKYGYMIKVSEKGNDKTKIVSILTFLDETSKYRPKIITRFKGLGESNSDVLWDTTLNPNTRILIKYTMEDAEKALAIMEKLHGHSKKNVEDRKDMMKNYKIKREDLDN